MQDGKALQAGTSHFLGQNFARAFDCTFQNKDGEVEHVWATSWGVSTRLIGALIMTHGDDQGIIVPPKLAPIQVGIVPITGKAGADVLEAARRIAAELSDAGIRVHLDDRDQYRPGYKFAEAEVQGIPVRLALGGRDLENGTVELARRDLREKETVPQAGLVARLREALDAVQTGLYDRALAFREANTHHVESYDAMKEALDAGGFVVAPWDGSAETEARVKDETKATIRCVPFPGQIDGTEEPGTDPVSGQPAPSRVVYARSY